MFREIVDLPAAGGEGDGGHRRNEDAVTIEWWIGDYPYIQIYLIPCKTSKKPFTGETHLDLSEVLFLCSSGGTATE